MLINRHLADLFGIHPQIMDAAWKSRRDITYECRLFETVDFRFICCRWIHPRFVDERANFTVQNQKNKVHRAMFRGLYVQRCYKDTGRPVRPTDVLDIFALGFDASGRRAREGEVHDLPPPMGKFPQAMSEHESLAEALEAMRECAARPLEGGLLFDLALERLLTALPVPGHIIEAIESGFDYRVFTATEIIHAEYFPDGNPRSTVIYFINLEMLSDVIPGQLLKQYRTYKELFSGRSQAIQDQEALDARAAMQAAREGRPTIQLSADAVGSTQAAKHARAQSTTSGRAPPQDFRPPMPPASHAASQSLAVPPEGSISYTGGAPHCLHGGLLAQVQEASGHDPGHAAGHGAVRGHPSVQIPLQQQTHMQGSLGQSMPARTLSSQTQLHPSVAMMHSSGYSPSAHSSGPYGVERAGRASAEGLGRPGGVWPPGSTHPSRMGGGPTPGVRHSAAVLHPSPTSHPPSAGAIPQPHPGPRSSSAVPTPLATAAAPSDGPPVPPPFRSDVPEGPDDPLFHDILPQDDPFETLDIFESDPNCI